MGWSRGAAEQWKAQDKGNLNAKDWCDEACQIIERVMEDYWNESLAPPGNAPATSQHTTASDEGNGDHGAAASLASEYDHHHCMLIERTAACADSSCYNTVRTPTLCKPDTSDRPYYFLSIYLI
jgi:hypothetical protein